MEQRDTQGRFSRGAEGGRGRPKRTPTEEQYLARWRGLCTTEDWEGSVKAAIAKAKEGEFSFVKLLCEYLIGQPTQYVETQVTGADPYLDLLKELRQSPVEGGEHA